MLKRNFITCLLLSLMLLTTMQVFPIFANEEVNKEETITITLTNSNQPFTFRLFEDEELTHPVILEDSQVTFTSDEFGRLTIPAIYANMYLVQETTKGYLTVDPIVILEQEITIPKLTYTLVLPETKEDITYTVYHNDEVVTTLKQTSNIGEYLIINQSYTVKPSSIPSKKKEKPLQFEVANIPEQSSTYTFEDLYYVHVQLSLPIEDVVIEFFQDDKAENAYFENSEPLILKTDSSGSIKHLFSKGTYYFKVDISNTSYYEIADIYTVEIEDSDETVTIQVDEVTLEINFSDDAKYRVDILDQDEVVESYINNGEKHISHLSRNHTYIVKTTPSKDLLPLEDVTVTISNTKQDNIVHLTSKHFVTRFHVEDENGNYVDHIKVAIYNTHSGEMHYALSGREDVILQGYYADDVLRVSYVNMKDGYYGQSEIEVRAGYEDIIMHVQQATLLTISHDALNSDMYIQAFNSDMTPLIDRAGNTVLITSTPTSYYLPKGNYYLKQMTQDDNYYSLDNIDPLLFTYTYPYIQEKVIHVISTNVTFRVKDEKGNLLNDVNITLQSDANDTQTLLSNQSVYLKRNQTYKISLQLPASYRQLKEDTYVLPKDPQENLSYVVQVSTQGKLSLVSKGKDNFIKASYSIYSDEKMTQLVKGIDGESGKGMSDGNQSFQIVLPHGDYYIHQDSVDGHYWLFDYPRHIHIDSESHDVVLLNETVSFHVITQDENENIVSGVEYALLDNAGKELTRWISTSEEIEISHEKLVTGLTYQIQQIDVPKGYERDNTTLHIQLPLHQGFATPLMHLSVISSKPILPTKTNIHTPTKEAQEKKVSTHKPMFILGLMGIGIAIAFGVINFVKKY